ncbi:MAG TPA: glycerophosphodiester phosphodiesterase family protein [Propionicimonas sp.]|uniref:glycerophosphodiester phosphodiesterase family protein n=1 Tax=Propionicimonas sp. TaxID=1955623 RepID=UPI002F406CF5
MATANQGRIFISYRRQETSWPARQLYEVLVGRFGAESVFKDVDDIDPGDDFVERITEAVASCDVLLALIGNQWLTMTDVEGRRRLDNPEDFVRLELTAALSRGVRVVPILVDGAAMPRAEQLPPDLVALTRRQAVEISAVGFNTDRLLVTLAATLDSRGRPEEGPPSPPAAPESPTPPGPAESSAPAATVEAPSPTTPSFEAPGRGVPVAGVGQPTLDATRPTPPAPVRTSRRWLVPVAAAAALVLLVGALLVLRPWTGQTLAGTNRPTPLASATAPTASTATTSPSGIPAGPVILAHRGGLEEHQFETQQAMEAAAAAGFAIETDVRYTSDGVAVLVHDEQATKGLDCGGRSIRVSATTWSDLNRYCRSKPTAKDSTKYPVPRLDSTLEGIAAASDQVLVFLEVKTELSSQRRKEFLATPGEFGLTDRTVFTSFNRGWLDDIRKVEPATKRMLFVDTPVPADSLRDDRLYAVAVEQGIASKQYIADLQAIGVKVLVWTVNDPKQWASLVAFGPDMLMTDYPARFKDWLSSR